MKIMVLGAGRMGLGAAYDLAHNSPDVTAITVVTFRCQLIVTATATANIVM